MIKQAIRLFVLLNAATWLVVASVHAQSDENEAHKEAARKAADQTATREIDKKIASRAAEAARKFRSDGMADLVRTMSARVQSTLGANGDEAGKRVEVPQEKHNSTRAILFASSSIPIHTLRRYAAQLETVGGVMVFRGVPGGLGALKPMVELTQNIIKHDPGCMREDCKVWNVGVLIDPLLFRNNNIVRVPAMMIVDDDPFAAYCERPDDFACDVIGPAITYGDAHLTGHLEALSRLGDRRADGLLQKFYQQKEAH